MESKNEKISRSEVEEQEVDIRERGVKGVEGKEENVWNVDVEEKEATSGRGESNKRKTSRWG